MTIKSIPDRERDFESTEGAQSRHQDRVDQLAELLPADALEDALRGLEPEEITGPGGLLTQLAGRVIETALGAELTEHLGHPPGGVPSSSNVRNGATTKTLQTDLGPVQVKTPRDRDGSFEPRLVGKRQTRLAGLDEKVIALYAGGMTVRDISAHLSELYGTEIGRDSISRITDAVLEDVAAWRTRPLDQVYAIVYFDAMMVKVREDRSVRQRACYLALGVTCDGDREVLGIWWQDSEGAKFWLAVLNDLRRRGIEDVLIACVDGLKGFPDAIEATYPQTWVQTCIVHLIRASLRYVNYRDSRRSPRRCGRSTPPPTPTTRSPNSGASSTSGAGATRPRRRPGERPGSTSHRSWRCPTSCAARSTRPTRSRGCTARSERRSRRAGTSPTNRPPPS
jgi:putative transposase